MSSLCITISTFLGLSYASASFGRIFDRKDPVFIILSLYLVKRMVLVQLQQQFEWLRRTSDLIYMWGNAQKLQQSIITMWIRPLGCPVQYANLPADVITKCFWGLPGLETRHSHVMCMFTYFFINLLLLLRVTTESSWGVEACWNRELWKCAS